MISLICRRDRTATHAPLPSPAPISTVAGSCPKPSTLLPATAMPTLRRPHRTAGSEALEPRAHTRAPAGALERCHTATTCTPQRTPSRLGLTVRVTSRITTDGSHSRLTTTVHVETSHSTSRDARHRVDDHSHVCFHTTPAFVLCR